MLRLPLQSGAYRWYYADITSGDFTAVFIFMVGAVFSPRYVSALRKGALPVAHSAVNFALYEKGIRKQWVFSEYDTARFLGNTLHIGSSSLELRPQGGVRATLIDRTAIWRRRALATLDLEPLCPMGLPMELVAGQPHYWQPVAPMARGTLSLPTLDLNLTGDGYQDTNHGHEQLGGALPGWRWTRLHRPQECWVDYEPFGDVPAIRVHATPSRVDVQRAPVPATALSRTPWGLSVPRRLKAGGIELPGAPVLLETSPFYARLESKTDAAHALGEVAHFKRFHLPYVRWMAHFRSRSGASHSAGANL